MENYSMSGAWIDASKARKAAERLIEYVAVERERRREKFLDDFIRDHKKGWFKWKRDYTREEVIQLFRSANVESWYIGHSFAWDNIEYYGRDSVKISTNIINISKEAINGKIFLSLKDYDLIEDFMEEDYVSSE